jgi:hypothetical protein
MEAFGWQVSLAGLVLVCPNAAERPSMRHERTSASRGQELGVASPPQSGLAGRCAPLQADRASVGLPRRAAVS